MNTRYEQIVAAGRVRREEQDRAEDARLLELSEQFYQWLRDQAEQAWQLGYTSFSPRNGMPAGGLDFRERHVRKAVENYCKSHFENDYPDLMFLIQTGYTAEEGWGWDWVNVAIWPRYPKWRGRIVGFFKRLYYVFG